MSENTLEDQTGVGDKNAVALNDKRTWRPHFRLSAQRPERLSHPRADCLSGCCVVVDQSTPLQSASSGGSRLRWTRQLY